MLTSYLRVLLLLCSLVSLRLSAAPVDFSRDIEPIFVKHCYECHGAEKQKGDLRLDERASVFASRKSSLIVRGNATASELYRRITLPEDDEDRMPKRRKPLSETETEVIRDWLNQGATWPQNKSPRKHWAYVAPKRPAVPSVKNSRWVCNEIDRFVLNRLEAAQLKPKVQSERATLLRRVYLDLTGLPPTPAELDAFLNDKRADAYERVVDSLLGSPHYGERWARPWLDLARYADSLGYQRDDLWSLWPYRDWVIESMNADMPYDQFTVEQLASDLLPNPTRAQKVATGFNRCTAINVEAGSDQNETRFNQILDRVNTLGTVWLGTTIECAQCHNHKYDPFTQKEYYQLFAFFNNTLQETEFTSAKAMAALKFVGPYMNLQTEQLETNALTAQTEGCDPAQKEKRQKRRVTPDSVQPPRTLVMRELETPRATTTFIRGNFMSPGEPVTPDVPAVLHPFSEGPANRLTLARWLVSTNNPLIARVTVNRWWAEFFGRGLVDTPEDFGVKGNLPSHPELLDWLACEFMQPMSKQKLRAGHIQHTSPRPWSMKHIHRLIVTSATYRQAASANQLVWESDRNNQLYSRGPRFRMDAEMVRDNALSIAGLLSLKMGGPPVRPSQPPGIWESKVGGDRVTYEISHGEDRYRLGIYTVWKRTSPYPSFVTFDAPNRNTCVVKRTRSNTPLQALTLLNDPVYVEAAKHFAKRILMVGRESSTMGGASRQAGLVETSSPAAHERIRYAFRLCTGRSPEQRELNLLTNLYRQQLRAAKENMADAAKLMEDMTDLSDIDAAEFSAWYCVASALLNLDETITKG